MKNDAPSFCDRAAELMRERGKQYDKPEGERSMGRTVAAFNAITGRDLSEPEGWLLMLLLKQVRQWQQPGKYHADSAEDGVAYSALLAEALARMPEKQDDVQSLLDQARAAGVVGPVIEGVDLTDELRPVCPIPTPSISDDDQRYAEMLKDALSGVPAKDRLAYLRHAATLRDTVSADQKIVGIIAIADKVSFAIERKDGGVMPRDLGERRP